MKKKRLIGALALVLALTFVFTSCQTAASSSSSSSKVNSAYVAPVETKATLSFFTGFDDNLSWTTFQLILGRFKSAHPLINIVNTNTGSRNYNTLMNVKRPANDMPDIYGTAGWATILYDPFNYDLKNEPWAAKINSGIAYAVTLGTKVECLPMDQNLVGLTYNTDVMKAMGYTNAQVDAKLKTYDGWMSLCDEVKAKGNGVVPMFLAGGDGYPIGTLINYTTATYFLSAPKEDATASLLDGSFDWSKWTAFATKLNAFFTKGYLQAGFLTAKSADEIKFVADGKSAFRFGCANQDVKAVNPDFHSQFVPIPTFWADDVGGVFDGGEKVAFGILKTSKNLDDARIFLQYLADPLNIKLMAEANGTPPGLDGVTVDNGVDVARLNSFKPRIMKVFDRQYLPNGMWNTMNNNAGEMAAGRMTPQGYADIMKSDYNRLLAAAKATAGQIR